MRCEFPLSRYCIKYKMQRKSGTPDKCQQSKIIERLVLRYEFDSHGKFCHVKLRIRGKYPHTIFTDSAALKMSSLRWIMSTRYKNKTEWKLSRIILHYVDISTIINVPFTNCPILCLDAALTTNCWNVHVIPPDTKQTIILICIF